MILPELHVWATGADPCSIELRQTQPNLMRPRAELRANGRFLRLDPTLLPDGRFEFRLTSSQMRDLTVSPPNWVGRFLSIDVLHTLHEGNELRFWGWTYRLLRNGCPIGSAARTDGTALPFDRDGWLIWPRHRRDFAEVVSVLDHISLELHA